MSPQLYLYERMMYSAEKLVQDLPYKETIQLKIDGNVVVYLYLSLTNRYVGDCQNIEQFVTEYVFDLTQNCI